MTLEKHNLSSHRSLETTILPADAAFNQENQPSCIMGVVGANVHEPENVMSPESLNLTENIQH